MLSKFQKTQLAKIAADVTFDRWLTDPAAQELGDWPPRPCAFLFFDRKGTLHMHRIGVKRVLQAISVSNP